jgi:serine/threonine-protein kinase
MQYKGADKTTQQIGEELGVDYILEGTILRERPSDPTSRVRIIPQLIRVSDDTNVWAATYDEDMTEVFRVPSDIAERVAQGLDIAVLEPERRLLQARPTENLEAYEYYLRGHDYLWDRGWTAEDANMLQIAVDMLEQAVQLDSAFALAYAELAIAHWSFYRRFIDPTEERGARCKAAVDRALELQPDLPEAHLALGLYYYSGPDQDHERALEEFELVAQRQPNNTLARELIGTLQAARGEWDEALENAAWATYLDPRSADRAGFAGWLHLLARRYAEAEPYLDRATSLAPDQADPYSNQINLYRAWRGDHVKAREVVEEMITRVSSAAAATAMVQSARALIASGDYDTIFEQLSPTSYRGPFPFNYFYVKAEFYRLRGERERSRAYSDSLLAALEQLREERAADPDLSWYLAYAYAGLGRRAEAIQHAERTASMLSQSNNALRKAYMQPNLIWIYAMVGEDDAAMDQIEHLLSVPSSISALYLRAAQYPGSLRNHSRFRELLAR